MEIIEQLTHQEEKCGKIERRSHSYKKKTHMENYKLNLWNKSNKDTGNLIDYKILSKNMGT